MNADKMDYASRKTTELSGKKGEGLKVINNELEVNI
jgi:hypothetical protein